MSGKASGCQANVAIWVYRIHWHDSTVKWGKRSHLSFKVWSSLESAHRLNSYVSALITPPIFSIGLQTWLLWLGIHFLDFRKFILWSTCWSLYTSGPHNIFTMYKFSTRFSYCGRLIILYYRGVQFGPVWLLAFIPTNQELILRFKDLLSIQEQPGVLPLMEWKHAPPKAALCGKSSYIWFDSF